ncbi:hypothetical protein ACFX19_037989 [Malus domestica]
MPSPLLVDTLGEVPRQMPNFGITQEERLPKLMLPKEAQAWFDEFMDHIGGKKEDLPELSNFHVNMAYVLSAMFCSELDQPPTMEGDYLATELMTHVSVEEVGKEESGRTCLPKLAKKEPEIVYSDRMVFSRSSLAS